VRISKYQILLILLIIMSISYLYGQSDNADPTSGETITKQVISNGGTDGDADHFILKATVSQTSTGHGSSESFSLNHGFWNESGSTSPCQGMCGDANFDSNVNVSDAVWVINYVFVGGGSPLPVLACGDANSDGMVNVSDAVWIINYVFVGGGAPGGCSPGSPNWSGYDCCPFIAK
jgi:Dockerin type I domain